VERFEATYELATPAFIGDASGGRDATAAGSVGSSELRPPSVKGALRFWWRATAWPEFRKAAPSVNKALHAMHAEEARVFGLAASKERPGLGQGKVVLSVRVDQTGWRAEPFGNPTAAHCYLLNVALANAGQRTLNAAYVQAGTCFTLVGVVNPRRPLSDEERIRLRRALTVFGLLGGLGARSRHGFGSTCLRRLRHWENGLSSPTVVEGPGDEAALRESLRTCLGSLCTMTADEPPFSAFSRLVRIDVSARASVPSASSPGAAKELLHSVGTQMLHWRGNGRSDGLGGRTFADGTQVSPNPEFWSDHDAVYAALCTSTGTAIDVVRRAIFGLPHNYFFSSSGANLSASVKPSGKTTDRRASPLFLHTHSFESSTEVVAVHCVLRSTFLHAKLSLDGGTLKLNPPSWDKLWPVLHAYLDLFPTRQQVIPATVGSAV